MAIHFIVDSGSDILPQEAEKLGITVLPLTVRFGEEEFRDGVELSHHAFYEKLVESDQLPATSQIPPAVYTDTFEKLLKQGDTAVVITLSSRLSGTWQSAKIAALDYPERVFVVDSHNLAVGQRILVLRGLELLKLGMDAKAIAEQLDEEKKHIRIMALLDTLEYLKKGGRITATVAIAGSLLSIKPVVTVEKGEIKLIGKARGSKQANNLLRQLVTDCGGICFQKPFALAYSGLSDAMLQKYIQDSKELWEDCAQTVPVHTVGCTIGAHAGPGAIAVAFFENV